MLCKNCLMTLKHPNRNATCQSCESPLHTECAINDNGTYCDTCYANGESKPKLRFTIPSVIRRSYIELYRKCPFAFYNEVILGFSAPPTMYTQVGIDLHTLFDQASHGHIKSKKDMAQDFQAIFDMYPESLFPTEADEEKMWIRGLSCIDTFFEILPSFPKTPYATEETLQLYIGEDLPIMQITMDRIDLIDGMLEVIDYKTGGVMVGMKISSDLQAPLYINAIQAHYKIPVRKFVFYYLETGKTRTFNRIDEQNYECTVNKRTYPINLTDALREVNKIFMHIKNQQFNVPKDYKSLYWQCNNCHHKDEGRCEGAENESWKQY